MKSLTYTLVFFTLLLFSACGDSPITPIGGEGEQPGLKAANFGLVEVTISGIGTEKMTASAQPYVSNIAKNLSQPSGSSDPIDDGTIKMESISNGSFTTGTRGTSDGWRYLYATFKVRNATQNNFSYFDTRQNLTFLAVDTDDTYGVTAVSMLRKFNGDELTTNAQTIAENTIPTGAVQQGVQAEVKPRFADVLQVYTETDLGNFNPPTTVNNLFPYGFVTHSPNVTPNSRDIEQPTSASSYDGVVTFAFKIPLQVDANSDPFEITAIFLPVDDSETHLTQALEEETAAGREMLKKRAAYLTPSYVTIFPGSTYRGAASLQCQPVRVAGTDASPVAELFASLPGFTGLTPDPYGANSDEIPNTTSFSALFNTAVTNANHRTFVVNGRKSGTQFIGEAYTYAVQSAQTPQGDFFAGELIEVSGIKGFGDCAATVARYRVAASGNGNFIVQSDFATRSSWKVELGDLNGDGNLDLIRAEDNPSNYYLYVYLGDGTGNFSGSSDQTFSISSVRNGDILLADLNEDGNLDVILYNSSTVHVLFGSASGHLDNPVLVYTQYSIGIDIQSVAIGDVDGNGTLDLAIVDFDILNGGGIVSVLLSDGTGSFYAASSLVTLPTSISSDPRLALGDLNNDGALDIVVGSLGKARTYLGDNSGTFGSPKDIANAGIMRSKITLADMNGDGYPDLVGAGQSSSEISVSVAFGDGSGGFGSPAITSVGSPPGSASYKGMAIADVNGDGQLDILATNAYAHTVQIFENSTGSFTAGGTIPVLNDPVAVAIGDINNDGTIDVVTANVTNGLSVRVD